MTAAPTVQLPMTLEVLLGGDEPGNEAQFCPVLGLPIKRTHRVRTLPGFHLLSLDAGKEAMARGSYEAFSQKFQCEGLEHLHPEDKVFICPQDNKAFLNQMSMRYHQYIRHELQERKAERKRLRERAEERKARADRHRLPPEVASRTTTTPMTPMTPMTPGVTSDKTTEPAQKIRRITQEPFHEVTVPTEVAAGHKLRIRSEDPRLFPAPPVATPKVATPGSALTNAPPEKSIITEKPLPSEEDDLYGNLGGDEAKGEKIGSSYASAMNAMLKDDFDEDDF